MNIDLSYQEMKMIWRWLNKQEYKTNIAENLIEKIKKHLEMYLRSCSFYDGKADIEKINDDDFPMFVCNDCNACSGEFETEQKAIEAWNRRPVK